MPHLIETYALNCGLKIDKPFMLEKFFPIDTENFITVHPNSKYSSKCYDYWQDVIDIIKGPLKEKNIDILQIGTKEDIPLNGTLHSQGLCDLNQTAYVISKADLHLGVDSFPAHVASGYNKKIVCLYSNTYANIARPYWTNNDDCVLLEPNRETRKPSYAADENPKTINEINPEDIAQGVFDLLNIKINKNFNTVRKGPHYNAPVVQLVPDCVAEIKKLKIDSLIVRMDLNFNLQALNAQLAQTKCSIVSEEPIDLELLKHHKANIKEFIYFINKNHNPEFVGELFKLGFPVILMSEMSDEEINKTKIHYMDYGLIRKAPVASSDDINKIRSKNLQAGANSINLQYKSKRVLISQGKFFHSEAAWRTNQPSSSINPEFNPVIDHKDFWESLDEFYIIEKEPLTFA
tara:strand:+ start:513 stop:1727 length:1215 start_codon:yes stop_codon:yes gene_type:complete